MLRKLNYFAVCYIEGFVLDVLFFSVSKMSQVLCLHEYLANIARVKYSRACYAASLMSHQFAIGYLAYSWRTLNEDIDVSRETWKGITYGKSDSD